MSPEYCFLLATAKLRKKLVPEPVYLATRLRMRGLILAFPLRVFLLGLALFSAEAHRVQFSLRHAFMPRLFRCRLTSCRTTMCCKSNSLVVASMSNQKWKGPNALKHGVFAATAIIPGEDRQEFEELHTSLIQEWQPDGPTEEDAVLDIAKSLWRKRRVQKLLEIQLLRNSFDLNHPAYDEELALEVFAGAVARAPEKAFEEWTRALRPEKVSQLLEKCPRAKFKTTVEWAAAVVDEINSQLVETVDSS